MANDNESHNGPTPEIQKLNLTEVSTRRRHMLGEEIVMAWNSYKASSTALCARLIRDASVEAGESEYPDQFRTLVVAEFPEDVILVPTKETDESTIRARWGYDSKVYFYFEQLLKLRPLKIRRGFRAHITVSKYVLNNLVGLRIHFSEPRFAEIGKAPPSSPSEDTAASQD